MSQIDKNGVKQYLLQLQKKICRQLEQADGSVPFVEDHWQRNSHAGLTGGGITSVMQQGQIIEQGGVNFSHVIGPQLPPAATANRPELNGRGFEAMGLSLVIHPLNPHIPTSRC